MALRRFSSSFDERDGLHGGEGLVDIVEAPINTASLGFRWRKHFDKVEDSLMPWESFVRLGASVPPQGPTWRVFVLEFVATGPWSEK